MNRNDDYVYGINAIRSLLNAHRDAVRELLLARDRRDPRLREILNLAAEAEVPVHPRPSAVLSKLVGNHHHQGLVAVVAGFEYTDFETMLKQGAAQPHPLYLVLDGVQDPGNFGAILRSASLFGVQGVIIPKDRAVGVTPAVRKAAAGGAELLNIARVSNLGRAMDRMFKTYGVWMLALDQSAEAPLSSLDLKRSLGVVVGGEAKGLRPGVKKHCQMAGRIPQLSRDGSLDSLNVSVAAGVALYEVVRQGTSLGGS